MQAAWLLTSPIITQYQIQFSLLLITKKLPVMTRKGHLPHQSLEKPISKHSLSKTMTTFHSMLVNLS